MSAIGSVLLAMGHEVSGSDEADSRTLRHLEDLGATVHVGHHMENLRDADLVARSTAVAVENVEVVEAERRGLRVWRRSELLAAVCATRRTVAVGGTHGKTTTSSMLFVILREAGWHPSAIIGGEIAGHGSGAAWDPEGEWIVVEADESDGTFLRLDPAAAVVTSVEADHLDYYGDERALHEAFERFVNQVEGPVVLCADDVGAAALSQGAPRGVGRRRIVTYGGASASSVRITGTDLGAYRASFALESADTSRTAVSIRVPGMHNVRNAAAAVCMAHELGLAWDEAAKGLSVYSGVGRRLEPRGSFKGAVFLDDYGHLPREVASAIAAGLDGRWSRVVVAFQPHRYSRTRDQWSGFADAFVGADVLILTDIYPAGERPLPGVSGRLIFDAVTSAHPDADVRYIPTLDGVARELTTILSDGDLCLTLGAGDITRVAAMVVEGGARGPDGRDHGERDHGERDHGERDHGERDHGG